MKHFLLAFMFLAPFKAISQTIMFRHHEAKFESYEDTLRSASFRISPMDELEKRLKNDELSPRLQNQLGEVLTAAAQSPSQAYMLFEEFYRQIEQEPRSAAIRETMQSLLDRLLPEASSDAKLYFQTQLQMLKSASLSAPDLRLQNSLLQKEIQNRLQALRKLPGGEDLTLFWNGIKWREDLTITSEQKAQWIFVSSQWKPRNFNGTWGEVSPKLDQEFANWMSGTCEDPIYQDVSFVAESQREALFSGNCVAGKEMLKPDMFASFRGSSLTSKPYWKPLMWTGIAATALVVILSASGKRIQISR